MKIEEKPTKNQRKFMKIKKKTTKFDENRRTIDVHSAMCQCLCWKHSKLFFSSAWALYCLQLLNVVGTASRVLRYCLVSLFITASETPAALALLYASRMPLGLEHQSSLAWSFDDFSALLLWSFLVLLPSSKLHKPRPPWMRNPSIHPCRNMSCRVPASWRKL